MNRVIGNQLAAAAHCLFSGYGWWFNFLGLLLTCSQCSQTLLTDRHRVRPWKHISQSLHNTLHNLQVHKNERELLCDYTYIPGLNTVNRLWILHIIFLFKRIDSLLFLSWSDAINNLTDLTGGFNDCQLKASWEYDLNFFFLWTHFCAN